MLKSLTFLLSLAVAVAGWPLVADAEPILVGNPPPLRNPDYRGELRTDSRAKVSIKVVRDGTRVLFQAREVLFHCEDGYEFRSRFTTKRARLRDSGTFDIDRYLFGSPSLEPENQAFYRVHGQLLGAGRARGFLYYASDTLEAPGEEGAPDCSTLGKRAWAADGGPVDRTADAPRTVPCSSPDLSRTR